jgi:hypothetical protein
VPSAISGGPSSEATLQRSEAAHVCGFQGFGAQRRGWPRTEQLCGKRTYTPDHVNHNSSNVGLTPTSKYGEMGRERRRGVACIRRLTYPSRLLCLTVPHSLATDLLLTQTQTHTSPHRLALYPFYLPGCRLGASPSQRVAGRALRPSFGEPNGEPAFTNLDHRARC